MLCFHLGCSWSTENAGVNATKIVQNISNAEKMSGSTVQFAEPHSQTSSLPVCETKDMKFSYKNFFFWPVFNLEKLT